MKSGKAIYEEYLVKGIFKNQQDLLKEIATLKKVFATSPAVNSGLNLDGLAKLAKEDDLLSNTSDKQLNNIMW